MRHEADLVVDCRNDLGEMPVWCARTRTLFWIDVTAPGRLFHWQTALRTADFHQFDDIVTGLARRKGGGLLVAGARAVFEFEPATLRARTIFSLPGDQPDHRLNDGGCDRAGRFWVGSMQNNLSPSACRDQRLAASGRIYRIGEDGSWQCFEAGLKCPNAMCWSLDDSTFYVADSGDGWIYAYEFDPTAGMIGNRREFCRFEGLGIPDGAAVDAEGYIWNARWGAGAVARINPAGQVDRIVKVAATNPTACCFGGSNLDILYVTSARYGLSAAQLQDQPLGGGVFAITTDVPGVDKPAFGG
jgi:L-arabinonolactonase